MSFRQRLMLFTALAIAVTVAGASFAVWVVAKHELYAQLDQTVAQQVNQSGPFGGGSLYTVLIHPDGDRTGPLAGRSAVHEAESLRSSPANRTATSPTSR